METQIAKEISITENKARLDAACKKVLSLKIILGHILKGCLDEFKDFEPEEIAEKYIEGEPEISETSVHSGEERITGMSTEATSVTEGIVRYDILFYAYAPVLNETVKLIINIEAQNKFNPGYSLLKRAVYYCSRLISSQYKTEFEDRDYDGIKKVFSIWICTKPPVDKRNTITRFSLTDEKLVGNAEYDLNEYDLVEIVMVCLGGKEGSENYGGLIKMLGVLLSSEMKAIDKKQILENEYNIKMTENVERGVLGMCNISDGVYDDGMQAGMQAGMRAGKLSAIISLMETLSMTLEQALNALRIPEIEWPAYRELVDKSK